MTSQAIQKVVSVLEREQAAGLNDKKREMQTPPSVRHPHYDTVVHAMERKDEAKTGRIVLRHLELESAVTKRRRLVNLGRQILEIMHPGVSSKIPQDMDVLREASHALEYVDEMVADAQQALEEERDT